MKILVIDDEKNILYSINKLLEKQGYEVDTFTSPIEGLEAFKLNSYDITLIDYKMPEMNGITLLKEMKKEKPSAVIIMMTAYGTTETTIEAIAFGALDYLTKPFDGEDLLYMLKKNSVDTKETVEFNLLAEESTGIIGKSRSMQEVYKSIGQYAKNDINILITGESGTGKELVAKTIWKYSKRENERFIAINCSAIPNELLESELFGYEKGAFTGASQPKPGKFELANNGTIFLDEIGDMPFSLQAKLLRVLQDGKIERLGGTISIETNVRIISATNKDLNTLVKEGKFREDLFYRLNVAHIHLPPLRDRKDDTKILVEHFIIKYNRLHEKDVKEISKEALDALESHEFKGNVRELENVINRAVAVCSASTIEESDIMLMKNEEEKDSSFQKTVYKSCLDVFSHIIEMEEAERPFIMRVMEETIIKMALEHFNYNQVHTASFLGITRNTLRKRMEWYNLL